MRIIILVQGGVVQGVKADSSDLAATILDWDDAHCSDELSEKCKELDAEYDALPFNIL